MFEGTKFNPFMVVTESYGKTTSVPIIKANVIRNGFTLGGAGSGFSAGLLSGP
jgi:hypothetical protein